MAGNVSAEQERKYRRIIANAVDDGRISSTTRGTWLNRLRKDPAATIATLTSLTPTETPSASEPALPAWFD